MISTTEMHFVSRLGIPMIAVDKLSKTFNDGKINRIWIDYANLARFAASFSLIGIVLSWRLLSK